MKIGNVKINGPVALAPMAGVADKAFRELCVRFGASYVISEMVSSRGISYANEKTLNLLQLSEKEHPCAIQIFGDNPEIMAEAAVFALQYKPDIIDINMGCPAPKVNKSGGGALLMKNPELCGKIVEAVKGAVSIPVPVKIRAGWDKDSINAAEVAKIVSEAGADAICVHARTKEQLYAPGVDLSVIASVKDAVRNIPIIGNGDIYTADDAKEMITKTSCDGIMIGRGALGNPWLFSSIRAALEKKSFELPNTAERLSVAKELLSMMVTEKGERVGTAEAKKQIAWFIRDLEGAASSRFAIMNATGSGQILDMLDDLILRNS